MKGGVAIVTGGAAGIGAAVVRQLVAREVRCVINYASSRDEAEALAAEARDYVEELRRGGHYVASDALQSVRTATTLRTSNGRLTTTDGPFAETKEQLGGFILIEARDLNDAIRLAAKMPPARLGCVEVRPVKEYGCASQDGGG